MKLSRSRIAIASAALVAMPLTAICTAAVAPASPGVWGKTYSEAASVLQQAGYMAQVGAKVGSLLPEDECLVTGQRDVSTAFASRDAMRTVVLALNCYPEPASSRGPGYSAADPNSKWLENRNAAIAAEQPAG